MSVKILWTGCRKEDPEGYLCTRILGHYGNHWALTPDTVVNIWPNYNDVPVPEGSWNDGPRHFPFVVEEVLEGAR